MAAEPGRPPDATRPAHSVLPRVVRIARSTRLDALTQHPDLGSALREATRASLRHAGNPATSLDAELTGPAGQALTTTLLALDAVLVVREAGREVAEPLAGFLSSSGVLLLPAGREWLRVEIAPPRQEETSAYREAAIRGRRIGLALAVTRDGGTDWRCPGGAGRGHSLAAARTRDGSGVAGPPSGRRNRDRRAGDHARGGAAGRDRQSPA